MKYTEQEKAARRAAFQNMSRKEKLDYVYTYYKWPILFGLIALIILGSVIRRQITKKEPLLYLAVTNVVIGEDMEKDLTEDYLRAVGAKPRRQEVYIYKDLYISGDADTLNHEYAYASRIKLMGAVNSKRLDLVLMNRESFDLLSRSGYLMDLEPLLAQCPEELSLALTPCLSENEVILSDNSIDYQLGESEELKIETQTVLSGIDVSGFPLIIRAGFPDTVYLGIIANSPRTEECIRYLEYLSLTDYNL